MRCDADFLEMTTEQQLEHYFDSKELQQHFRHVILPFLTS